MLPRFKGKVIDFIKFGLGKLGIGITSYNNLTRLLESASDRSAQDLEFVRAISPREYEWVYTFLDKSQSQLRQDLFVLSETECKNEGFFVEFGAADGIHLSNTYLLETEFSWKGILAEPARVWHERLRENRPNASIDIFCVWSDSNSILIFNETENPELSTIAELSDHDDHEESRKYGHLYKVNTISLNDLLLKHNAPSYIDYLSIDTEGSEYEILKAFNFTDYNIAIISVEHNYGPQREMIFRLLTSYGYIRKYESVSGFDDWYVKV
jgi:FkbM family methyltransferase